MTSPSLLYQFELRC